MKKYFNSPDSLEELRKQYKELLKKFHPDNPQGSTEAFRKKSHKALSMNEILER